MRTWRSVVALSFTLMPLWTTAHHSFAAFDSDKEAIVRGTISGYRFLNPHVYFTVDVPQQDGSVATWRIETETRNDLYRNGWRDDSLQNGDIVTVRVNPPKNLAQRFGRLISLEKSDGTVLATPNEDDERGRAGLVAATDMSGVWLPIQSFFDYRAKIGPLTTKSALSERAELRAAGYDRRSLCIDTPIPETLGRAHVHEIDIVSDDLVLIHSEDWSEPRQIFLDGRNHPAALPEDERSYRGHSIGHWEGETLVVDTNLFKPMPGEAGPRKHLVERYRLSDDRTHIVLDFTIEDPDYLSAPVSHSYEWVYSPHIVRLPYSCDMETADWYLEAF